MAQMDEFIEWFAKLFENIRAIRSFALFAIINVG